MRGSRLCFGVVAVIGLTAYPAVAQSPASVRIGGVVLDDAHSPIASAELALALTGRTPMLVRSGGDGRFEFIGVPLTPGAITVRRLGYRALTVTLDLKKIAAGQPLELAMETIAEEVEPVIVDAAGGRMQEFYDHRDHNAFGHFIDQAEIRKRAPRFVSELFRTIPGAKISPSHRIGNTITLRGCQPRIYVDGVRTQEAELDEVANVDEIAALEIYPSWAGTPPQYMDRESRMCGSIVVWTRRQ